MQQLCGVHIIDRFNKLVYDILFVYWFQNICPDDSMQVCLHKVKYKIYVPIILRLQYVPQTNNIVVSTQLLQILNFSVSSLRVCCVSKSIEAFL